VYIFQLHAQLLGCCWRCPCRGPLCTCLLSMAAGGYGPPGRGGYVYPAPSYTHADYHGEYGGDVEMYGHGPAPHPHMHPYYGGGGGGGVYYGGHMDGGGHAMHSEGYDGYGDGYAPQYPADAVYYTHGPQFTGWNDGVPRMPAGVPVGVGGGVAAPVGAVVGGSMGIGGMGIRGMGDGGGGGGGGGGGVGGASGRGGVGGGGGGTALGSAAMTSADNAGVGSGTPGIPGVQWQAHGFAPAPAVGYGRGSAPQYSASHDAVTASTPAPAAPQKTEVASVVKPGECGCV
jgi:hypothetical protein